MTLKFEQDNDKLTIQFHEEFNVSNINDIHAAIFSMLQESSYTALYVQLEKVTEFDSAALQLLMMLEKQAVSENAKFIISNLSDVVKKSTDLLGLTEKWVIAPDVVDEKPSKGPAAKDDKNSGQAALSDIDFSTVE